MKSELVFGIHTVNSLLRNRPDSVLELWLLDPRRNEALASVEAFAHQHGLAVSTVERASLDRMVDKAVHQGVVARVRPIPLAGEAEFERLISGLEKPAFLLFLDGVQDPHNLGACIRTAEAAGVDAVIFPKDRASNMTPVARKAAVGAADRLPLFQVSNLARTIETAKKAGIWVVGAAGDTEAGLFDIDLTGPLAIIMGGEGTGLRARIRALCDHLGAIPMAGQAESLNVSVATGVVLFEACRQRLNA